MYQHFRKLTSALLTAALLLTSLGMGSASAAGNETIDSFSKAKKYWNAKSILIIA